jgi:hypothetical protein
MPPGGVAVAGLPSIPAVSLATSAPPLKLTFTGSPSAFKASRKAAGLAPGEARQNAGVSFIAG